MLVNSGPPMFGFGGPGGYPLCWVGSTELGWAGLGSLRSGLVISPQGWCSAFLVPFTDVTLIMISKFWFTDRTHY